MTLVGALLLATTHITLLDVTGGILTGAGLLVTGGALVTRRGRMRREVENNLKDRRALLGEALGNRLKEEIEGVYRQIEQRLDPLVRYVGERKAALQDIDTRGRDLGESFARLSAQVDQATAAPEA
jgi:hypothetical protein